MGFRKTVIVPAGTDLAALYANLETAVCKQPTEIHDAEIRITKSERGRGETTIYMEVFAQRDGKEVHVCNLLPEKVSLKSEFGDEYKAISKLDAWKDAQAT